MKEIIMEFGTKQNDKKVKKNGIWKQNIDSLIVQA